MSDKEKIEAAICKAISKPEGELTSEDLEKVTSLDLSFNKISDVTSLKELTQLTGLDLSDNQLTDVTGLENLTQLTSLTLNSNQLTDVKGLENLTQLTELELGGNDICDISPLASLTQLKELELYDNLITNVSALEELSALEVLNIGGGCDREGNWRNTIEVLPDFSKLQNLKDLAICWLWKLHNIEAVAACSKLERLDIRALNVTDLTPLENLHNLSWIYTGEENNQVPSEEVGRILGIYAARSQYCEGEGLTLGHFSEEELNDDGKGELDFGGDATVSTDHIKIPDNENE